MKCTFFWRKFVFLKIFKKSVEICRYSEIIGNMHLFFLHNEQSLIPVGWKLGGVCFEVTRNVTLQEWIIEKLITHQELIEGIKVWIFFGYPSNLLGYISKYCNYTSKKKLGQFPQLKISIFCHF